MRENRLRGNLFDSYKMYTYINASPNYRTIHTLSVYFGLEKKGKCCYKHNDNGDNHDDNHPSDFLSFILSECEFGCENSAERKHRTQCIASRSIISICGRKALRFLFANGNYFDRRQMFFSVLLLFTLGFGLTCVDCSSYL